MSFVKLFFFCTKNLNMRIPFIVNKNTIVAYSSSAQTRGLIGESLRKFLAENFEWDKEQCPTLEDFCVNAIAKHFKNKPILDELPCHNRVHLLEVLPLDLPLELIIPLINDEYYWERRYKEVFKYTWRTKPPNWTWKSQYLERHCQKLVEEAEPQYNDEETFGEILALCNPYVTRLFVEQLQTWKPPLTMEKEDIPEVWPIDHISMLPIFKTLNNIEELNLIFGRKNVGEDFTWDMFKVSTADCQKIGKAIQELTNLKILRIHRSNLEFNHCQALMHGLVKYPQLEVLDLSHCNIMDTGALCVAYVLKEGTNLRVLNLTNNGISKIGCEGIGFAMLQGNCENLTELNLRLNPLGSEGTMAILRAIVRCTIPKKLSLAACAFEQDILLKITQMLKLNESLKIFDISSNWFGEEMGKNLAAAVETNRSLEWLDIRETDISREQQDQIKSYLERNRKAALLEIKSKNYEDDEEFEEYTFVIP